MRAYLRFLGWRLALYAGVLLVALLLNFVIPRLIPGNPIRYIVTQLSYQGAQMNAEELIEEYKRMFGLDQDLATQFVYYVGQVLSGNLGYSITSFPAKVGEIISRAIPWTLGLLSVTTVISWLLGNLLGIVVGWRGIRSRIGRGFAYVVLALGTIPYYILALIIVFLLAYTFPLLPSSGGFTIGSVFSLSFEFIIDVIRHSILPALSIVLSSLGWWFLSSRALITEMKGEDFILMAEAKGLPENMILWKYGFRNCILPQVTGLGLSIGNIFGGAMLTEVIFAYPGIGWVIYNSIISSDYPVIQGTVLLVVVSVCTAMLLLDLLYPFLDPRIRK